MPVSPDPNLEFDLSAHAALLLHQEPFYLMISRRVSKIPRYDIKTLQVSLDRRGNYILEYNPKFLAQYKNNMKILSGFLIHELMHIILFHLSYRSPWNGMEKEDKINTIKNVGNKWNHATDLAINSHLPDLHEEGKDKWIIPGYGRYSNYPSKMSSEWYFSQIPDPPETEMQFDNHPWADESNVGDGSEVPSVYIESMTKTMIYEGVLHAEKNGWGTVHGHLKNYLLEVIGVGKVDWRSIVRSFTTGCMRGKPHSTVRRVNRRMPHILPWGRKVDRNTHLLIGVDVSGSVSDELLKEFFLEIDSLSRIAAIDVIQFDWKVFEESLIKWDRNAKFTGQVNRVGAGGTSFQDITDYANNHMEYDGLIILTDMEAHKPEECRVPRLWCVPADRAKKPYFETQELVVGIE